jgi:glycosyltransferase involved in cell wall biosynthesis
MKKIRVGYLMHGLGYGGAFNSLILLLKSIKSDSIEIYIYTINSKYPELEKELKEYCDSFQLFKLPTLAYHQYGVSTQRQFTQSTSYDFKNFHHKLQQDQIEILHINSTLFSHLISYLKLFNSDIKIITHLREIPVNDVRNDEILNYVIRNNYKSDALIAISDMEANPYQSHPEICIVPNPYNFKVNTEPSMGDNIKAYLTRNVVKVGMSANFIESKGHMNFVKSVDIIINHFCNTNLVFYILGNNRSSILRNLIRNLVYPKNLNRRLTKYIKGRNLNSYIKIIPFQIDVKKLLQDLDIYVRPADTGDPWGRDIIEAMALKKPVIATGISEFYVENGVTGFLVPPKNPEMLADKILELINNEHKRILMGEAGHNKIKQMCDLEEYGKKVVFL